MDDKAMSGAELEQALMNDKFPVAAMSLTGMVKKSEKPAHIAFTRTGCDTWVDLPIEMIESAEHIGQQACKEHRHPLMRIALKNSDSPPQQVLMALLAQAPASNALQPSARFGVPGHSGDFLPPSLPPVWAAGPGVPGGALTQSSTGIPVIATLGCGVCVPGSWLEMKAGVGHQSCVELECTLVNNRNYCRLVTRERACSNVPTQAWY